ncbi:hypothetical protein [Parafrankia elaeagni]|uniref:hypothetical protein n=1 Tax=Parafrankia elaeagni TaxID=222534 RepID=UPI000369996A|nr:hypothetical protein [Parafrankia elaeagni]
MTAPATGIPPGAPPAARAAAILCEIAAPTVLVTALLLLMSWADAPDAWHGLLWATVSILFCTVVPMAFVLHGVRRRRWSDHHVPERSRRMAPMLFGCASVTTGYVLLHVMDASTDLVAVYAAIVVEAFVLAAITRFWKISGHVAAAASCATVLTLAYGPLPALTWLLVPVIGWARVQVRLTRLATPATPAAASASVEDHDELDGHTPAQAMAGAVVAAVTVTATYLLAGGS